jgi:hypothetical protein
MLLLLLLVRSLSCVAPPPSRRVKHRELYRYSKPRREIAIDGIQASNLVCWEHIKGKDCVGTCAGRAHLWAGACGKAISGALGCCSGCEWPSCFKPHPENVVESLVHWREDFTGLPAVLGTVPLVTSSVEQGRSAVTAIGGAAEPECTVPAHVVRARFERHAANGASHIQMLLTEGFIDALLDRPIERRLLSRRGSLKEVSEAYGVLAQIRELARKLDLSDQAVNSGAGLTILDVCSGRGVVSLLLSRLLPEARVVMLDANPSMNLAHVACTPNLHFVPFDLFGREAGAALQELSEESEEVSESKSSASACICIGMHLCGALSPRLLALAASVEGISAYTCCPCCIKGTLGQHVKQSARRRGVDNYECLLETLRDLATDELGGRGEVSVRRDEMMISPRNGFVSAVKRQS